MSRVVGAVVCATALAMLSFVFIAMQDSEGSKVRFFGTDSAVPVVSIVLMGCAAAVVIALAVIVRPRLQDRRG